MFDSKAHRIAGAVIAVGYIAIQSFQWFVFAQLPEPLDPAQGLLQGAAPLNVTRAVLMLLSFFGLVYLALVACGILYRRRPAMAITAFLGFFTFCLLEVMLRSVELFYIYLRLPAQYLAETDPVARAALLDIPAVFGAVQYALYFPLGLSWIAGSLLLCLGLGGGRYDWLARFAFGLNALRLILRTIDTYIVGPRYDALYGELYLPLVFLTFGPIALWLLLPNERRVPKNNDLA